MSAAFHVYAAFSADLTCLYVGQTENLARRMEQHRSGSPWVTRAAFYSVTECATRAEALDVERERIGSLRPLYNVAANPCHQRVTDYWEPPREMTVRERKRASLHALIEAGAA